MKALFLKTLFYFRSHPVITILLLVFTAASFIPCTAFLLFFQAALVSVMPMLEWNDDVRCRWNIYAGTLPFSRRQRNSAIYLKHFLLTLLLLIPQIIRICLNFSAEHLLMADNWLAFCLLLPAIYIPLQIRFGNGVGSFAVAAIGMLSGAGWFPYFLALSICDIGGNADSVTVYFRCEWYEWLPAPAAILLFILSWCISAKIYEKHEF